MSRYGKSNLNSLVYWSSQGIERLDQDSISDWCIKAQSLRVKRQKSMHSLVRWKVQRKPRFSWRFKRILYVFYTQSFRLMVYVIVLPRHKPCGQCILIHMELCPPPPTFTFFTMLPANTQRIVGKRTRVCDNQRVGKNERGGKTENKRKTYVCTSFMSYCYCCS